MGRLGRVLVAYLASCALASLALSALWAMEDTGSASEIVYRIFARAVWLPILVGPASLPVIVLIAYAEYARERRYLIYALCGLLAGVLPLVVTSPPDLRLFSPDNLFGLGMFGASGLLAATLYWLIAGRHAGRIEENQQAS
jgi:hypothetical protein